MSNDYIHTINVGGLDYPVEDAIAREQASTAVQQIAYYEVDDVASQSYPDNFIIINWKGKLYYTIASITQGAPFRPGENLLAIENASSLLRQLAMNINVYVGSDGNIHFTNARGADSVLPFKKFGTDLLYTEDGSFSGSATRNECSNNGKSRSTSFSAHRDGYVFIGAGLTTVNTDWDWHRIGSGSISYNLDDETVSITVQVGIPYWYEGAQGSYVYTTTAYYRLFYVQV